jgi:hypothetical protein
VWKRKKVSSAEMSEYLIQVRNTFLLLLFFVWVHRRGVEKKGGFLLYLIDFSDLQWASYDGSFPPALKSFLLLMDIRKANAWKYQKSWPIKKNLGFWIWG